MKMRFLFILVFCLTNSIFSKEKCLENETLENCNLYIKNNPNDSLGYFIRADLLWNTNRELALSDLETANKMNKDSCPIDFNTIIENKRDYSRAYYKIAVRLYDEWVKPSKLLDDRTKRRIVNKAVLCMDRAISLNSYRWDYKYYVLLRKRLKMGIKDFAGAKADYLALNQKFPNDPDYLWELGDIEIELRNYSAAEVYYSQAIERRRYEETDSYYPRARLRVKMKNYKGALEDYNKIIAINSELMSSNQYYERANVKRFLKDYAGALEDYNRALTIIPFNPINYGNYYYDRGNTKSLLKDYKGAYEDYTKAIKINSALGIFYQARAYAAIQMNDYQAAKTDLLLASDLLPENKEIRTDLETLEILVRDSKDK